MSVVGADGQLRLWPLKWGYSAAWLGPSMVDTLPGKGRLRLSRTEIPESGVHVDVGQQLVGVWTTSESRGLFDAMSQRWPGWQIECWNDGYEEQARRCGGALRLPDLDLAAGTVSARDWLRKRVFQSFEDSPAGAIVKMMGLFEDAGLPEPQLGSEAVLASPLQPSRAAWNRWEAACEGMLSVYTKSA